MTRWLLLIALSLTSQTGTAGVVSRDLFEPGDGLLTYDDVNQREWLDFSVTAGLSLESVLAKLTSDTRLDGFQSADLADIDNLVLSAFSNAPWWPDRPIYGDPGDPQPDWIAILGEVGRSLSELTPDAYWPYVGGRITPLDSAEKPIVVLAAVDYSPPQFGSLGQTEFRRLAFTAGDTDAFSAAESSYWLYRDAASIPEPTTACLTLAACLTALRLRAFA